MQFGIIALNNSMLHLKIFLLALISFAYITPPLHADLPMFILACFIHSFSFIKHLECIISAAPLYFWSVRCCWCWDGNLPGGISDTDHGGEGTDFRCSNCPANWGFYLSFIPSNCAVKVWWLCHQKVVLLRYSFCFRECRFLTFPALWVALWVEVNTGIWVCGWAACKLCISRTSWCFCSSYLGSAGNDK